MRPSFIRAQWTSSVLFSSTSKRCRICPQKFVLLSRSRSISTSQASTQSRDVNADLPPTTQQGSQPAARSVASSLPRHSLPDRTVAPTESTPKRRRKGSPRRCTITTLDPARLDSSCFLDISGATHHFIYDSAAPESPRFLRMIYARTSRGIYERFPPDARGSLYFHADARDPLLSQIRFRVVQDHDPARSFISGHDLTYGSGFTWHIPLVIAAKNPKLREVLLRDGLVDDALLAQLQARLPADLGSYRLKRAVSVLDQPFILDFKNWSLDLVVRIAGQDRRYHTDGPLTYYTGKSKYLVYEGEVSMLHLSDAQRTRFPAAGSALCRLERSDLPQHARRRIVVMRLLKILQPPKRRPDLPPTCNLSVPAEGEIFTFSQRMWYRDVDRRGKSAEILRLLYDAPDDGEQASGQSS